MTIEDLEKYRSLYTEIGALSKQIESLYNTYHSPSFSNNGGGFNGEAHSPIEQALQQIQRLEDNYAFKIQELRMEAERIENWLTTLDDPFLRSCIRYHYMLGYSWKETSRNMYGYESYYNARKVVFRFFGKE